jgi:hypothetical protein
VGQVARSITAEEVTELRTLAAFIEAALEVGDILGYLEADRLFHLALLGLTGNQRLVDIVGSLRSQTRMYNLHRVAEQGGLALSLEEHSGLLDRLAASDADGAEEVMRRHLRHIRFSWAGGLFYAASGPRSSARSVIASPSGTEVVRTRRSGRVDHSPVLVRHRVRAGRAWSTGPERAWLRG